MARGVVLDARQSEASSRLNKKKREYNNYRAAVNRLPTIHGLAPVMKQSAERKYSVRPATSTSLLNTASAKKKITAAKFRVQKSDCSGTSFANSDMRLRMPCQKKNRSRLVFFLYRNRACEGPRNRSYRKETAPGHTPVAPIIIVVAVAKPTAKPSRTAAESEDRQKASPHANATARCYMSGPSPSESSFFPPFRSCDGSWPRSLDCIL